MFKFLYPDIVSGITFSVDFESLFKKGYKGIIFDIDNTLTGHGASADERAVTFLHDLMRMGFKICLLSNNKEQRVLSFNKTIGAYTVCNATKPCRDGYDRAVKTLGLERNCIIAVGDQIFTDIWGARRAGIKSILVERLYKKETVFIHIKRAFEKPILALYKSYAKKHVSSL